MSAKPKVVFDDSAYIGIVASLILKVPADEVQQWNHRLSGPEVAGDLLAYSPATQLVIGAADNGTPDNQQPWAVKGPVGAMIVPGTAVVDVDGEAAIIRQSATYVAKRINGIEYVGELAGNLFHAYTQLFKRVHPEEPLLEELAGQLGSLMGYLESLPIHERLTDPFVPSTPTAGFVFNGDRWFPCYKFEIRPNSNEALYGFVDPNGKQVEFARQWPFYAEVGENGLPCIPNPLDKVQ